MYNVDNEDLDSVNNEIEENIIVKKTFAYYKVYIQNRS